MHVFECGNDGITSIEREAETCDLGLNTGEHIDNWAGIRDGNDFAGWLDDTYVGIWMGGRFGFLNEWEKGSGFWGVWSESAVDSGVEDEEVIGIEADGTQCVFESGPVSADDGTEIVGDFDSFEELPMDKISGECCEDGIVDVLPEIDSGPCVGIVNADTEFRIDAICADDIAKESTESSDVKDGFVSFGGEVSDAFEDGFEHFFGAAHGFVMIDLLIHVISADEVGFNGVNGAETDGDAVVVAIEHFEDTVDVIEVVSDAGHVTVPQDIIHSVGIELTGYDGVIPFV